MNNPSKHKLYWILVVALLMIGIIVSGVAIGLASTPQMTSMQNPPKVWIVAGEPSEIVVRNLPPKEFLQNAPQAANITVTYVGSWDAQAQAAFEYAVSIWETQITSPIEIRVEASWENLGPGILGGAGAAELYRDFPGAPVAGTWYPVALANKLTGSDLDSGVDITAAFNSAFSGWYFGTDGNPGGDYDFVSVVLHEIGHGLGFFGSMSVGGACGSGNGCWGYNTGFPSIYDRFTENGSGTALLSFPNNSSQLATQLTSNSVYFDGPNARLANGNNPAALYAPGSWQQGSSYSHLAESFNGTGNALMTYSIGPGEAQHAPGPVTLGIFADMGWTTSTVPTATPTKTLTPTATPTCIPVPLATPLATPNGGEPIYLPVVQYVISCAPTPTKTPTPTVSPTPGGGYTNLLFDNFEGAFPGPWQLFSFGATGGYAWGQSNCNAFQSSFSAWGIGGGSSGSGYPCNANYPLNVENWMMHGPFSTVGFTAADLSFATWFNTESGWDFMCYLASSAGGTNPSNYEGWCWSGNSQNVTGNVNGWISSALNLANIYGDGTVNYLGDSSVWITFVFFSDDIITFPTGAFVDNALLRGCVFNCVLEANADASQSSGPDGMKIPWKEFLATRNTSR